MKSLMTAGMVWAIAAGAAQFAVGAGGDPAAGQNKSAACVGCHGVPGYRTAFPSVYSVPKLRGQHPAYLVKALQAYRSGERAHPSMRGIASSLSEQDMADLVAYYGAARTQSARK